MRIFKLLSVLFFVSILCLSCEKETEENVVFYSKDQLTKDLAIQINDTEGSTVSVNSNTVLSLSTLSFFNEHMAYLRDLNVPKMSFKIKNYNSNSSGLSNVKVFLDEIQITDDLGVDFLNVVNNNIEIEISNQELLDAIASKLLQNKQVVISYYSDAITQSQLEFDFEFSITARGTFVD
jgi:hypothetical protein